MLYTFMIQKLTEICVKWKLKELFIADICCGRQEKLKNVR